MIPTGPHPTVDLIILLGENRDLLLIERGAPPYGWALPGGFVDSGETFADAARREAREETGLEVELTELFHCYSDPRRDPRRHTVSTVFLATAEGTPRAGDDAAACRRFSTGELPAELCFDHRTILEDYLKYRRSGTRPPVDR